MHYLQDGTVHAGPYSVYTHMGLRWGARLKYCFDTHCLLHPVFVPCLAHGSPLRVLFSQRRTIHKKALLPLFFLFPLLLQIPFDSLPPSLTHCSILHSLIPPPLINHLILFVSFLFSSLSAVTFLSFSSSPIPLPSASAHILLSQRPPTLSFRT